MTDVASRPVKGKNFGKIYHSKAEAEADGEDFSELIAITPEQAKRIRKAHKLRADYLKHKAKTTEQTRRRKKAQRQARKTSRA